MVNPLRFLAPNPQRATHAGYRKMLKSFVLGLVLTAWHQLHAQSIPDSLSVSHLDSSSAQATSGMSAHAEQAPSDPTVELPTKTVRGKRDSLHEESKVGHLRLTAEDIRRTADTQGDPMRAVAPLPGVHTQNDLAVKPYIRGGKSDETRVFLDGMPLLQPYHFAGAYSPFNPELIEKLDLYRSDMPVNHRDALSGAVVVTTREPKGLAAVGELSWLRANAVLAIPLPGHLELYGGFHSFFYELEICFRGFKKMMPAQS